MIVEAEWQTETEPRRQPVYMTAEERKLGTLTTRALRRRLRSRLKAFCKRHAQFVQVQADTPASMAGCMIRLERAAVRLAEVMAEIDARRHGEPLSGM